jgi:hypothetical protein
VTNIELNNGVMPVPYVKKCVGLDKMPLPLIQTHRIAVLNAPQRLYASALGNASMSIVAIRLFAKIGPERQTKCKAD